MAIGFVAGIGLAMPALGQCEVAQIYSPGPGEENMFGVVSLDGDLAAVGDTGTGFTPTSVSLFRLTNGQWLLEAHLPDPDQEPVDGFGRVALCGDWLVVGAPTDSEPENISGSAYVYRKDVDRGWLLDTELIASDGAAYDAFGRRVAIEDQIILIGSPGRETEGLTDSGAAYIFRRIEGQWVEETILVDTAPAIGDFVGTSVALAGDLAVIGAPGTNSLNGSALVFRCIEGQWVQEAELTAYDAVLDWRFGWSVETNGEVIVVGAILAHTPSGPHRGAAYIFRRIDRIWRFEQKIYASQPGNVSPFFGSSVSMSADGDSITVGAPLDSSSGFEAGTSYVFRYDSGAWFEVDAMASATAEPNGSFGVSMSISGDIALVGGHDGPDATGAAHVIVGIEGIDCNGNANSDACDIFNELSEDENGDNVPDECQPAADLSGDGVVNALDLSLLLSQWGSCQRDCNADLTGDAVVGPPDLAALLVAWG